MLDLKVSMEVAREDNLRLDPVEKGMLLIKLTVDAAQEKQFMKIREIIHIKILSKIAITQKTCMKTTQTTTKTNKVIIMGNP